MPPRVQPARRIQIETAVEYAWNSIRSNFQKQYNKREGKVQIEEAGK